MKRKTMKALLITSALLNAAAGAYAAKRMRKNFIKKRRIKLYERLNRDWEGLEVNPNWEKNLKQFKNR